MGEITNTTIKAYALDNAIKHNGKANKGSVLSALFSEGLDKSDIKKYAPLIEEIVNEVNSFSINSQESQFLSLKNVISKREVRTGLPELPNVITGKVVMRMAPFPSGAIHIGNTRPLILNDEYVKIYNGKFLLIIDDTIGSEAKSIQPESYKLIEEDARWLGCNFDKVLFKSDRIPEHYKYSEELIKKGYMYVCSCPAEKFKEFKLSKKECPCRNNFPEINLELWKTMFDKNKTEEGDLVVRLKTDMKYPDPAFRDRVMFKISDRPHPRTGTRFRVYPTMEFSWAIDNHYFGITHIIRGVELDMEGKVEEFIRKIFDWENPVVINNGHLILEGVKLSKSKGLQEVKSGKYIGWNDPRLWSIQSLKSRGIRPEAIREFIISQGVKRSNTTVPIDILYKINKKYVEHSKRYFFVENPKKISISGSPNLNSEIPFYPDGTMGYRNYQTNADFLISQDDYEEIIKSYSNNSKITIRLMHLLNFSVFNLDKNLTKPLFSFISVEPQSLGETKYIHWLTSENNNVKTEVIMPDGNVKIGLSEPEIQKLQIGEIIQFERFGFVRLDKKEKNVYKFFFTHK